MGIDWETILGASGADLQDAYDDYVQHTMEMEERYQFYQEDNIVRDEA